MAVTRVTVSTQGTNGGARGLKGTSMKLLHLISGAGIAAGSLLVAPAAHAAVPGNDTFDTRESIASVPFATSVDTTGATSDADDQAINEQCGAPATDASVWYSFTAPADGSYVVSAASEDYSAGVAVASGGPGAWDVLSCAPQGGVFEATAGSTYTVMVFDDQLDGAGNGGHVDITVDEAPPSPEVDVALDPRATFNADGSLTLTGSVTCSEGSFLGLDASVTQAVGRVKINGYGYTELECDGTAQPFSMNIWSDNGIFKGGKAATVTFAFACGEFACGEDYQEQTVIVSGGKRR